jgi:hypothetical protein
MAVGGCGDTAEYDVFLCMHESLRWVRGIMWGYVFVLPLRRQPPLR